MTKTVLQILTDGLEKIKQGHTKGAYFRNKRGKQVSRTTLATKPETIARVCAYGAIKFQKGYDDAGRSYTFTPFNRAEQLLETVSMELYYNDLISVNDGSEGSTKHRIVKIYEEAIKREQSN